MKKKIIIGIICIVIIVIISVIGINYYDDNSCCQCENETEIVLTVCCTCQENNIFVKIYKGWELILKMD